MISAYCGKGKNVTETGWCIAFRPFCGKGRNASKKQLMHYLGIPTV
jgi:hypothetical protein